MPRKSVIQAGQQILKHKPNQRHKLLKQLMRSDSALNFQEIFKDSKANISSVY